MITLFLCLLVFALLALLVAACIRIEAMHDEITDAYEQHDQCHRGAVAVFTKVANKKDADVLRAAAIAWESVEEVPNILRIGRELYRPGGPNVPALWLNDRADKLDPPRDSNFDERLFSGEPA